MLDTMKKLDETGQRILFIAPEGKLKAVVTDGDIRKCILRGGALSAPLTQAANYHPHSLPVAERGPPAPSCSALALMLCPFWTSTASSPILCLRAAWMWTTAKRWISPL